MRTRISYNINNLYYVPAVVNNERIRNNLL